MVLWSLEQAGGTKVSCQPYFLDEFLSGEDNNIAVFVVTALVLLFHGDDLEISSDGQVTVHVKV